MAIIRLIVLIFHYVTSSTIFRWFIPVVCNRAMMWRSQHQSLLCSVYMLYRWKEALRVKTAKYEKVEAVLMEKLWKKQALNANGWSNSAKQGRTNCDEIKPCGATNSISLKKHKAVRRNSHTIHGQAFCQRQLYCWQMWPVLQHTAWQNTHIQRGNQQRY